MKLTLIKKISLPFALLAVTILLAFGTIYTLLDRQLLTLVEQRNRMNQISSQIQSIAADLQSGILAQDDRYFISAAQASLQVESALKELEAQHADLLQGFMARYQSFYTGMVAVSSVFMEQRLTEGQRRLQELHTAREEITAATDAINQALSARYKQSVNLMDRLMLAASVLMLLILAAVLWMIRLTLKPIYQMRLMMQQIAAGEGDLTQTLPANSQDEIGDIARAFNRMMQRLRSLITDVQGATIQIASAAEQQSQVTAHSLDLVNHLHSQAEQVSAAVHEMASASQDVSQSTIAAREAAHEGRSSTERGEQVVNSEMEAVHHLADEIEEAAQVIRELNDHSHQIGGILGVIRDIADQTNLLALNAAIEAARAGEQGRGFAVVADEVRSLATRTQEATGEIEQTIEILQRGAGQAVNVMARQQEEAHKDARMAEKVIVALADIKTMIQKIEDMNIQVSSAAEEQSAVAEVIDQNVLQINNGVQEIASGTSQLATASQSLAQLADNLKQLAGRFRV